MAADPVREACEAVLWGVRDLDDALEGCTDIDDVLRAASILRALGRHEGPRVKGILTRMGDDVAAIGLRGLAAAEAGGTGQLAFEDLR